MKRILLAVIITTFPLAGMAAYYCNNENNHGANCTQLSLTSQDDYYGYVDVYNSGASLLSFDSDDHGLGATIEFNGAGQVIAMKDSAGGNINSMTIHDLSDERWIIMKNGAQLLRTHLRLYAASGKSSRCCDPCGQMYEDENTVTTLDRKIHLHKLTGSHKHCNYWFHHHPGKQELKPKAEVRKKKYKKTDE